jgi:hypothetical protein
MKTLEEIANLNKNKVASVAAMVANLGSNDPSPHLKVMADRSMADRSRAISSDRKLPPELETIVRRIINKKRK